MPDGLWQPKLEANFLQAGDVELAVAAIFGDATNILPCLYVSRDDANNLPFDPTRLAKELAGVCHVLVEPSDAFSFDLMEATRQANPYGGAVSLFSPSGDEVFRLRKKDFPSSQRSFETACATQSNQYVSSLAIRKGWEWQDLQEAQSRKLRELALEGNSGALDEYVAAFDAEITAKEEKIAELQASLSRTESVTSADKNISEDFLPPELKDQIGRELYEGEFSDRLHAFLQSALQPQPSAPHKRTNAVAARLLQVLHLSGRANGLIGQIKGAGRDGKQMPRQLGAILSGFGFEKSLDGPHIKYTPPEDLFGLQIEVLPSTPSDSQRGGKNRASEVIKSFGLDDLT